jgi:uncharacterized metal-binding protein
MGNIYYLLKFFLFFFAIGAVLMIVYFIKLQYQDWRKKKQCNEDYYEMKFNWLQKLIKSDPVNDENYKFLFSQLVKLGQMKHKNKEKTCTLSCEFFRKFKGRDEHSPDNLDFEECEKRLKSWNEALEL